MYSRPLAVSCVFVRKTAFEDSAPRAKDLKPENIMVAMADGEAKASSAESCGAPAHSAESLLPFSLR